MASEIDHVRAGAGWAGKRREVIVVPGNTYRIEPLNPQKKKNRGRTFLVTGFRTFGAKRDLYASGRWLDTDKPGWTCMAEFVQV